MSRWIRKPRNCLRAGLVFHSLIFYLLETKLVDSRVLMMIYTNVCNLQLRIIPRCCTNALTCIIRQIYVEEDVLYGTKHIYCKQQRCLCRNCRGFSTALINYNSLVQFIHHVALSLSLYLYIYIYIRCTVSRFVHMHKTKNTTMKY